MSNQLLIPLLLLIANPCCAQQLTEPSPWKPLGPSTEVVEFADLKVAKLSDDGKFVRFVCPQFKPETRSKKFTVCKITKETRTRTEKTSDGSKKEVSYEVEVPAFVEEERKYMAMIPYGSYRMTVPVELLKAWDLTGNSVDKTALSKKLSIATHVLVQERVNPTEIPLPVEPYFASILKVETLRIQLPAGASAKFLDPASRDEAKGNETSESGKR